MGEEPNIYESTETPATPQFPTPTLPTTATDLLTTYQEQTINLLRHSVYAPLTITNERSVFTTLRPVPAQANPEGEGSNTNQQDTLSMDQQALDIINDDWEGTPEASEKSDNEEGGEVAAPEVDGMDEARRGQNIDVQPHVPLVQVPTTNTWTMADWQRERGIPVNKIAENSPDPFAQEANEQPQYPSRSTARGPVHHGLSILYMLVAWLHLQFHLPFRACNVILSVVPLIARAFGATVPAALTTLNGVLNAMDLEPNVRVYPVCPRCKEVYPEGDSTPSICVLCSTFMFKESQGPSTAKSDRVPLLRFPTMSIEEQLTTMLSVPGVEDACDNWRKQHRTPGKYDDNFDGKICQEIPAFDGQPFFRNLPQDVSSGPDGELRIGLTLGVDWYIQIPT